jgi:hypothetical protein
MRFHPVLAAALLCAASMTMAACGNSVAAGSKSPKIDPAFVGKVNAFCAAEARRYPMSGRQFPYPHFDPDHPDLATLPKVGSYFAAGLPERRKLPARLNALGEPATGRPQWDRIRGLALQENAVAIRQVNVALASQAQAFTETAHAIHKITDELHDAARNAGFSTTSPCGQLF